MLVSGTDVAELVLVLRRLLDDPDGRRAMGRAGRDRAVSEFSWERAAELTRHAHERVVADDLETTARIRSEVVR